MKRIENKHIKNITILILAILSMFLLMSLFNVQAKNSENTKHAQTLIESFYKDDVQLLLKKEINQEQIDNASQKIYAINSWNKSNLVSQMSLIQDKYDATQQLGSYYQTDNLLDLKEDNVDLYPLEESVTIESFKASGQSIIYVKDAYFNDYLRLQYDAIENTLNQIQTASDKVGSLPIYVDSNTLNEDLTLYQKVENQLLIHKHHPHAQLSIERYQHNGQLFVQELSNKLSLVESNPEQIQIIFENKLFSQHLAGSEIDNRPLVALTFDDGPSQYTPGILEILSKYNIKAAFFQLGQYIELYPEISRMVVEADHIVGNHSYSHANFDLITDSVMRLETQKTQDLILEATGQESTTYRTPYGNGRRSMLEMYPHLTPVYWNVDSQDWISKDAKATIERTLETLEHRSIILMHDSQESTLEALEELILELIARDYVFVTPEKIPEADSYIEEN